MYYSIDRFVEQFVLCEDDNGCPHRLPRHLVPPEAKSGDLLRPTDDGAFVVDREAASTRRSFLSQRKKRMVKPFSQKHQKPKA